MGIEVGHIYSIEEAEKFTPSRAQPFFESGLNDFSTTQEHKNLRETKDPHASI
jgi:hypothetical protein